jgi:ribosome biogenesis GTPase
MKSGLILSGSNNLFNVLAEGQIWICGIKGKVLRGSGERLRTYNALCPGDVVDFEENAGAGTRNLQGSIHSAHERRSVFSRFNAKGVAVQAIAANVDQVACIASAASPPFHPRFIDRVLVQAAAAALPAIIVMNKADLRDANGSSQITRRTTSFERLGYKVFFTSVASGSGLYAFKRALAGKITVLVGQSGVGKSSLINAIAPDSCQKTGVVNPKHGKGSHTTAMSRYIYASGFSLIDTPGMRLFTPAGVKSGDLVLYMPEFAPLAGKCAFPSSCSHTFERGCAIVAAFKAGDISIDRYESFIRMREELAEYEGRRD